VGKHNSQGFFWKTVANTAPSEDYEAKLFENNHVPIGCISPDRVQAF